MLLVNLFLDLTAGKRTEVNTKILSQNRKALQCGTVYQYNTV
jgi:hypothetical protein